MKKGNEKFDKINFPFFFTRKKISIKILSFPFSCTGKSRYFSLSLKRKKSIKIENFPTREKVDKLSKISEGKEKYIYYVYISFRISLSVKWEVVVRSLRTTTPSPELD